MANRAKLIPPDTKLPAITTIGPITLAIGVLLQVVIIGTPIICGAVRADFGTPTHRHVPFDSVRPAPVNAPPGSNTDIADHEEMIAAHGSGRRAFGSGPERPHETDLGEIQGSDFESRTRSGAQRRASPSEEKQGVRGKWDSQPFDGMIRLSCCDVRRPNPASITRSTFSPGLSGLPVALRECP